MKLIHSKNKKIRDLFDEKLNKLFTNMTEKPLTDLDGNILKGIVWKKFKEDDVDFVDFWELDPDLIGWLKWSKPKVDAWW